MKVYDIYSLIRTRTQGEKEKKEFKWYDGPYSCNEDAKEEIDELNKDKKSIKYITKDNTTIQTSFQLLKRNPTETEKSDILEREWEMQQDEIENQATIIKPEPKKQKKKAVIENDEARTRLTIFPQAKEGESCLEAQTQY